jgi:hypothetical protein
MEFFTGWSGILFWSRIRRPKDSREVVAFLHNDPVLQQSFFIFLRRCVFFLLIFSRFPQQGTHFNHYPNRIPETGFNMTTKLCSQLIPDISPQFPRSGEHHHPIYSLVKARILHCLITLSLSYGSTWGRIWYPPSRPAVLVAHSISLLKRFRIQFWWHAQKIITYTPNPCCADI